MGRHKIPEQHFERINFDARFRVPDVARLLNCATATVYRLKERGDIGFVQLGSSIRFTEQNVRDYLAKIQRRSGAGKMSKKAREILGV